ncbi:MAG: transglycosylase SLT domain-containing protein, partial [Sulfuritalea sp.]|nr:transglycosylase SLT domain-containing protein [Sulfuritalea sp.]
MLPFRPMSIFRRLIPALLFLLPRLTHAEQALQLTAELGGPPALNFSPAAPATPTLLPDPSQEVKDELPPIPTIDLTTPPDDLWQRMRNGFSMPDLDSPLVADRQAWYLNRPDLLKRVFERSRRYLHHIVDELEKRGMPTELALLPVVESSFNPLAYSSARALGMWQFIPSTGK